MSHLKAYCLYHNEQVITNFCKDKNCLMPLCPTCIRQHTQYHQDIKTKPSYFSIYEIISEVKQLAYAAITHLQQDNLKRAEIVQRIDNWNAFASQTIAKARQLVISWVQAEFVQIEKDIFRQFHQKQEELGAFSKIKTQKWETQITKTTTELYDLFDSLKTEKFLGSIIIFLEQTQSRAHNLHSKFASFQQTNDAYSPRIEISKGFKRQFSNCLSKMFRVETNSQRDLRTQERPKSPRFLGKSKIGTNEEKFQKLQRSYTPQKSSAFLKNGPQSSRIGFTNNLGYSNRGYKQESPQRMFLLSPKSVKNENLSPTFQNRRSVYRNQR